MISIVVGIVLTPTCVTDTVGTGVLLLTVFFAVTACVKRNASKAMMATPMSPAAHSTRRGVLPETLTDRSSNASLT
jgi:hypothetical protein